MKIKNFQMLRIHDNIKPIPLFAVRPKSRPSVTSICELDQLLSEVFQKFEKNNLAFCIITELSLQSGNILIPEDFHRAPYIN